jgi:glutathione S-transferase
MAIGPVTKPTLYVCHVDTKMPLLHPCAKAHKALTKAGVDHDKIIFGQGQPFGIGANRPDLKELSGQEKLPVLQLPDGEVIAGSGKIVSWAKAQS